MSDHLTFDLVEDILLRLDGEDLIRCKSVCKSWLSFISSSSFVNNHLKYNCNKDYNNEELGYRRIIVPTRAHAKTNNGKVLIDDEYYDRDWCIVGSSNGLVCFTTSLTNTQVVVTNPLTREIKKLQTLPRFPKVYSRSRLCFGFGYDSLTDDYKVVMGTQMDDGAGILFRVLTLKSNVWKVTRQVKYKLYNLPGILWNGAFHWFMQDYQSMKKVILSFDVSREEFKEIPQPDDLRYVGDFDTYLGITEGCLCIYRNEKPYQRWVMKTYNDKQSWELLPGLETNTYDVAHMLKCYSVPHKNWCLCDEDGYKFYSTIGKYIRCPIYVHSLVSPHLNGKPKHTKNQKGSDEWGVKLGCYFKVFSCFTPYKAEGPFLPLVPKAASIPLVGRGVFVSQPSAYTVEDGIGIHNLWKKAVLGVAYLHNILKRKRRSENIKMDDKICSEL